MENVKYRFIQNVGDYFPSGYFDEDFLKKIRECAGVASDAELKKFSEPFGKLRTKYDAYKNDIINQANRTKDAIEYTHKFNSELLEVLGYSIEKPYERPFIVNEKDLEYIPVRHVLSHNGKVRMLIMEMQNMIPLPGKEDPAGLFNQRYNDEEGFEQVKKNQQKYRISDWEKVFTSPEGYKISPAIINKAISMLFLMPEERRPHFILMLAGNMVFLFDCDKWSRGSYLIFDLDELFSSAALNQNKVNYGLFYLLVSKDTLAADSEVVLMDTIIEDSYKKAYEVTQDLKKGVVTAVEELANESLHYMKNVAGLPFGKKQADGTYDETDDAFEAEIKDDCLTIVYRLLFIFYAESRPELGILPTNDNVYNLGYSLEMLRDLEQVPLTSKETRDGYFFHDTISTLFRLIAEGHNAGEQSLHKSFKIRPVDSPLFSNKTLKHLAPVKIRNFVWQKIICALSLSQKGKVCGRISYANLGVNQLGSVYESLLAYRGFYAEEAYIEVHTANKPEEGTFLVPYSRHEDFDSDKEILKNENGEPKILKKGSFVYRLNGRDRQKSASYYTPEVLTRSTVKYTLKAILDEVERGERKAKELLELKILEPAMGAAAFQNEVINQLATAYLTYQRKELEKEGKLNKLIPPDEYQNELQKIKAYIATHNVYGVDLNPTAIELGKISLWLNVIHKDMQPPFFSNRLALGNAVLGAWLKVYSKADLDSKEWWEKTPHKVKFLKSKVKRNKNEVYHFLVPDKYMLAVRKIEEQKVAFPDDFRRMNSCVKDWTKPVSQQTFDKMLRISDKIDYLLAKHLKFQLSIENLTDNKFDIWDGRQHEGGQISMDTYSEKEILNRRRYSKDSAYYRLKMVMDYWCALWFWEYADANLLPMREEFLNDIEKMLDVPDDELRKQVFVSEDDDVDVQLQTREEILADEQGRIELDFAEHDEKSDVFEKRFSLVTRYSERYHFFHPMMEFIEVFCLRKGFDIICGNPPFLKWLFEPQQVLSEKYPELLIRPDVYDADYVEKNIAKYLTTDAMKTIYKDEQTESGCCQVILNTPSLYGELKGGQTDLFKCILLNSMHLLSSKGYMGLIHPDTVYTEAKGQPLREFLYPRLINRFHYSNRLGLFNDVHGEKIFDCCIYRGVESKIEFDSISNVFHPNTIDACYSSDGLSVCKGAEYVDDEGKKHLNTEGHKDRIVHYDESMLKLIAEVFEGTKEWKSCKLVSIYVMRSLEILKKYLNRHHASEINPFITEGFHATNAKKDNSMRSETKYPDYAAYEMIFNSTQVGILSPFSKLPQEICTKDSQYDGVDYTRLSLDFDIRTNYVPKKNIVDFKADIDPSGKWFERYKAGFKKMLDPTHERTLKGAILPPKSSHTHSIISVSFEEQRNLILFSGMSSSIVFDFFIKTVGVRNLTSSVVNGLPFGADEKYYPSISVRTLRLNCVNHWYKDLWESSYNSCFKDEKWAVDDKRLSSFANVDKDFDDKVLLRNDFERRQAMIELDVIVAMALGFSLEDLLFMYTNTFATTQKYEADSWYDANGRIAFTASNENDLDLDRKTWESIRGNKVDDYTYEGTSPSYSYTILPKQSELYGGSEITLTAPYTRCDRIADYRRAWAHFEKQFN